MTDVPSAALRLRDALYRNEGNILGLDLDHERVEIDETKPCAVIIKTDIPLAPDIPLLDVVAHPFRRAVDRTEIRELANRAFGYLGLTRVWRRLGTKGPPAGLLSTDAFTVAIVDHAGIEHQEFVDAAWRRSELTSFGLRSTPWRDRREKPRQIRFYSSQDPEPTTFPDWFPWVSGFSTPISIVATAAGFADGITVSQASGTTDRTLITVPRRDNIPIITAKGGNLQNMVRNAVLRQFVLLIERNEIQKSAVKYIVDWRDASRHRQFDDPVLAREFLRLEYERLDTSGGLPTRELEDVPERPAPPPYDPNDF